MEEYSKRDDSYQSTTKGRDDVYKSRGEYKASSRDDYKREVAITSHPGVNPYTHSSSSTSRMLDSNKYSERPSSTDFRMSGNARNDDSRNGSSKSSRFYESQNESRYGDRSTAVPMSSNTWAPPPSFSNMNSNEIWAAKQQQQQQESNSGWRGNIDDRSDYRFSSGNERKQSQFMDMPSGMYMSGNNAIQKAQRFSNNSRW